MRPASGIYFSRVKLLVVFLHAGVRAFSSNFTDLSRATVNYFTVWSCSRCFPAFAVWSCFVCGHSSPSLSINPPFDFFAPQTRSAVTYAITSFRFSKPSPNLSLLLRTPIVPVLCGNKAAALAENQAFI
ncbi:unnamed protein product [Cuscuta epithymum]|uniref:Secreted protein n=1 Tax=Cuscuta epithymum TaxID=186058 RepID=A0AAV0EY64_9ASTE|nr:unnamed protein product [Cuscuta epithymum]